MTDRSQRASSRTPDEVRDEEQEIADFNQNTGYDDRGPLRDSTNDEPNDLQMGTFIQISRCYDVLMTLLQATDADRARDLLELHMAGHLLGPTPRLTGLFLTDEMNGEANEADGSEEDREDALHEGDFSDTQ